VSKVGFIQYDNDCLIYNRFIETGVTSITSASIETGNKSCDVQSYNPAEEMPVLKHNDR